MTSRVFELTFLWRDAKGYTRVRKEQLLTDEQAMIRANKVADRIGQMPWGEADISDLVIDLRVEVTEGFKTWTERREQIYSEIIPDGVLRPASGEVPPQVAHPER